MIQIRKPGASAERAHDARAATAAVRGPDAHPPDRDGPAGASGRDASVVADPSAVAREFFAFADPTRVAVIELLAGGERCVCELVDALGAAQPRLSFHLRTLRDADVVRTTRRGRWIYYALNEGFMETLMQRLGGWVERSRSSSDSSCGCGGAEGCCG